MEPTETRPEKLALPLNRTRKLVRSCPDIGLLAADGAEVLNAAAEFMIRQVISEASMKARTEGKKTVLLQHIVSVLSKNPSMTFLLDALQPE